MSQHVPAGRAEPGRSAARRTGARRPGGTPDAGRGRSRRTAAPTSARHASLNGNRKEPTPVRGETPKARGERTRVRVADALLDLLEEGGPAPTAKAVAERAGVSVRLVFHHFEDMDALYRKVGRLQFDRHWRAVREVPPDLPLATRIQRTVQQRAKLFEEIGTVRRAGVAIVARSSEVAAALDSSDGLLRRWLETTFAPELRAAKRERRELLGALDAATAWETWDRLRRVGGLSVAAARRVMTGMLEALLET